MNTKIAILATVAALSLATTAFAGEGNGDPFPVRTNGLGVTVPTQDTGSAGYQRYVPSQVASGFDNSTLPEDGQNGAVQSANSLPRGFENGTVTYMDAMSVQTWLAQQADHRFAQAGSTRPHS